MGGKTSTSTSEVSIPPEVLKRYNIANAKASKAASKPFQKYKGDFVADVNNQQKRGIQTINEAKNAATPYYDQANQYMTQGTQNVSPEELNIEKYYSPYQSEVIDSTAKLIDQGNEQAMSGSLGDAIKSGGFGGDRAGVAAAVLAGQQQAQRANTLAGLKQQGYTQALGAAQQQQGVDLAARQADNARYLEAANQSMGLGTAAQQNALATGESQINAGTLQQQTKQAELTAKYQQFLQKRGYPFQTAQFLANIAMGTGSLSGSTTTTEQPAPFFSDRRLKKDIKRIGQTDEGLPIYTYKYKGDEETHIGPMADEVEKIHPEAVGVAAGYKTVDYDKATGKADGGVVGAYGHQVGSDPYDAGYVPDDWLKVGELLKADPSVFQKPTSGWDEIQSIAGMGKQLVSMKDTASEIGGWFKDGKASGGGVGAAYLSAAPEPPDPDETLGNVINQQEEDNQTARELKAAATPPPQQSGAASLGQAAGGVGSLLSGIAGIFALSDERAKTDIKRIGWTDDGKLPIYSFKYKGDEKSQTHIGPMAQDVEKVRPGAVKEFGGLKHVDLERATRRYGGVAGYADGGLVEDEGLNILPDERQYEPLGIVKSLGILPRKEKVEEPVGVVPVNYKETPHRYVPPGHSLSELDGQTLIKNRDSVGVVPKLETKTIKEQPTISEAKIVEETPLRSVDTPKAFAKVLRAGKGWTEVIDPEGKVIRREGTRNWRNNNPGNIEYGDTAKRLGAIGTDGRFAVFPTYEMGRKAKESLLFDNPNYKDKSISKAIYRYAPPEENDTEGYIAALTKALGLDRDTRLSDLTPEQRTVMMDAMQRVEGFKPGRSFVNGVQSAAEDVASGVKQAATTVADDAKEIPSGILSGIRNVGDKTGDVISDTTGGIRDLVKNATSNQDLMLSILSGLGTMASSDSRYLGSAILQGIGGGAQTYANLRKQTPEIASQNLDNVKKLTEAWQSYVYLNPDKKDLTLPEFAKQFGYEKYLPQNNPIDIVKDNESGIKLEKPIIAKPGEEVATETAVEPERAYDSNEFRNLVITKPDGTKVPAANDPGYLKAFIAKNAGKSVYVPALAQDVQAARDSLAETKDVTYDAAGNPVVTPGSLEAKSDLSQAENRRVMNAEFVKNLPAKSNAVNMGMTNLKHMEEAFRGFEPGAMSGQLSDLAALVKTFDPNGVSGVYDTLVKAGNNPEEVQKAKKYASVFLADQMKNMPGGAPASMIEFLDNVTPGTDMQPGAIRAIIVKAKGDLLREKAFIDAYYDAGGVEDIAKFEVDFNKKHPNEEFYQMADKATPPMGAQTEVVEPPTQEEIDSMTDEERKAILGQ